MHPIKAVFFDLDDTLWPIAPVIQRAEAILFEWLAQNTPNVVKQFTIESLRERRKVLLQENPHYHLDLRLLRHAGLTEALMLANEDIRKVEHAMTVFSAARNEVTLFDDVIPMLSQLRKRVTTGSISNGVADLKTIGLHHYFHLSIAAHQVGIAKPEPEIFHAACNALGIRPSEAVYIGDDLLVDVEGAQKAGLHAIWMKRPDLDIGAANIHSHIRPDAICTTLYELDHWLNNCAILLAPPEMAR